MSQRITGYSRNVRLGLEADANVALATSRSLLEIPGVGVFEVATSNFSVNGSGAQATFSHLQVAFAHDTGLARLMSLVASAQSLSNARLITLTTNDRGFETITSEIKLQSVSVSSASDIAGSTSSATLRFGSIEARTWSVAPDGSAVYQGGFTHNVASNTGGSLPSSPPAAVDAPVIATDPERYFLLIPGLNGGSTDPAHLGWFELTRAQFGVSSAGTANRPDFQSITVSLDSDRGLGALFYNLASGRTLVGARIDGVDRAGQSVFDLRLAEVRLDNVQESDAGGYTFGLAFSRLQLVTDGGRGPEGLLPDHSFTWNLATRTSDIGTMPALAVGAALPSEHVVSEYVLKVAGLGEFSVERYSVGGSNVGTAAGSGASTPDFTDITVQIGDDAGLAQFLGLLATGNHVSQANLLGLTPSPSSSGRVISYNMTLTDLIVSGVNELVSGGYVVSLRYSRIDLNTFAHASNGSVTSTGGFRYDARQHVAENGGFGSSNVSLAGTAAPVEPERFFLLIDGLNGGSTDPGHPGWFELPGYSINAGLGATGAAAFGSLFVSVARTAAFSGLFVDVAMGTPLTGVRIEGVNAAGQAVYKLNLADVVVSSVTTSASINGPLHTLGFNYGQISLVTNATPTGGGVGPDQTFAWNLVSRTSTVTMPVLTARPSPDSAPPPTSYVLQLGGLGEFAVTSFSFGATNSATMPPQSSSQIVASLQELSILIDNDAGLARLLAAAASGSQIARGSLAGLTNVEGLGPRITYDLGLESLVVRNVQEQADGGYLVSVSYTRVALSTFAYSPEGTRSVTGGFSYDLVTRTGSEGGSPTITNLAGTAAVIAPEKYFLLIDGLNGGSSDPDHVGWFELPSFSFGITRTGATPVFTDLSVNFKGSAGLAALLQRAASDAEMAGLRLEGVSAGGQIVYELNLKGVRVDDVHEPSEDGYSAQFSFTTVSLLTNANGVRSGTGSDSSFGWNLPGNRADSSARPQIAPALPAPGAGPDILVGGSGIDVLNGLDGSDQIIGNPGDDILSGGAGDDRILGGDGADQISGGEGQDQLDGGAGNDVIDGGSGHDILTVSGLAADYRLLMDGDNFILKGPDGGDRLTGVESIRFSDGRVLELNRMYGRNVDSQEWADGRIPEAVLSDGAWRSEQPLVLPGPAEGGSPNTKDGGGPEVLPGADEGSAWVWKYGDAPLVLPGVVDVFVVSNKASNDPEVLPGADDRTSVGAKGFDMFEVLPGLDERTLFTSDPASLHDPRFGQMLTVDEQGLVVDHYSHGNRGADGWSF